MRGAICFFTGHRVLPHDRLSHIMRRLKEEIDRLVEHGVTDFISGGALGFDQIAASLIIDKKRNGHDIRLIFALPCKNQDKHWSEEQSRVYKALLAEADETIYVSLEYHDGCMKKRNHYMANRSEYCICALIYNGSGTGQAVRYAAKRGICVINIAE